ncbi:MAG: hypothetical protein Q4F05_09035 [bacterium]|nr:hypothetical protein [bacterium]
MAGIGFIIFGAFVSLFGYVLITCTMVGNKHCTNRALAEIIDIKQLTHLEEIQNFFQITVTYIINGMPFTSTFITHSAELYEINKKVEVFCNPDHPSHIISRNEPVRVSPLFILITILGAGCLLFGILLVLF